MITQQSFPGLHSFVNSIALPIGISFYTFEGISYLVDVYRGDLPAERDLLRYAFFISFFPHLIAGPIVRYGILRPQLEQKHPFDADRVRSGLMLFTLGLAKKVLLADALAPGLEVLGTVDIHENLRRIDLHGQRNSLVMPDHTASAGIASERRQLGKEAPWPQDRIALLARRQCRKHDPLLTGHVGDDDEAVDELRRYAR